MMLNASRTSRPPVKRPAVNTRRGIQGTTGSARPDGTNLQTSMMWKAFREWDRSWQWSNTEHTPFLAPITSENLWLRGDFHSFMRWYFVIQFRQQRLSPKQSFFILFIRQRDGYPGYRGCPRNRSLVVNGAHVKYGEKRLSRKTYHGPFGAKDEMPTSCWRSEASRARMRGARERTSFG